METDFFNQQWKKTLISASDANRPSTFSSWSAVLAMETYLKFFTNNGDKPGVFSQQWKQSLRFQPAMETDLKFSASNGNRYQVFSQQ